jgi:CPA2 family monovalent cation:H+ antiporter-2
MLLQIPAAQVERTLRDIRNDRYSVLRNIVPRGDPRPTYGTREHRKEQKTVVIPPGAWAVGRSLADVRGRGIEVAFTGVRRQGILGRDPAGDTLLRDGDIVVMSGEPEDLEHAESVLLAG